MNIETKSYKALLRPAVWSNTIFLVPLVVALHFRIVVGAVFIVSVFVFSFLYHVLSEKEDGSLLSLDRVFAGMLTLYNAVLVAFGDFTYPYFHLTIIVVFVAMYLFRLQQREWSKGNFVKYDTYHALWHLCTATATLLSLLTFNA